METIYNWLLENTGNAGHYYTILNTHRRNDSGETDYLEIMARRTDNFSVVNLIVFDKQSADVPDPKVDGQLVTGYLFADERQAVDYMANGREPQNSDPDKRTGIQVLVLKPAGETGSITFPHEQ